MIIEWDPARPRKKTAAFIKESLEKGAIIGYPTDTFYGLGCDLFNIKAVKTLYAMRGLEREEAPQPHFQGYQGRKQLRDSHGLRLPGTEKHAPRRLHLHP